MVIRELTIEDIPAVLTVQSDAYAPPLIESGDTFRSKLLEYPLGCLGFFAGDRLVGYAFSHPWNDDCVVKLDSEPLDIPANPNCFHIHDVAVLKDYREKGIAKQLIQAIIALARELGLHRFLIVSVQNSERFWARQGFVAHEKFMYGRGMSGVRMVLDLGGTGSGR